MIVRAFYNSKAFKDVIEVVLHERDVEFSETIDNVTKLMDENKDPIGYNIIVKDFKSSKDGYQPMTYDLLRLINREIYAAFNEELLHDFNKYIVVGYVKECKPHPDSDHMHVCMVDVGKGDPIQIVCGASNVEEGKKVVVCLKDAVLPNGTLIQNGKLRGVASFGMLASAYELGLIEEAKKGIILLDDSYNVGDPFFKD